MLNDIFKEHGKCIKIYLAKETQIDPYEKNVELQWLAPVTVRALVTDYTFAQAQWKMPGIEADKAKEIIVSKSKRTLLEKSQKIMIDGEFYNGWRVNGQMQIRQEGDFLRVYVYNKKV